MKINWTFMFWIWAGILGIGMLDLIYYNYLPMEYKTTLFKSAFVGNHILIIGICSWQAVKSRRMEDE